LQSNLLTVLLEFSGRYWRWWRAQICCDQRTSRRNWNSICRDNCRGQCQIFSFQHLVSSARPLFVMHMFSLSSIEYIDHWYFTEFTWFFEFNVAFIISVIKWKAEFVKQQTETAWIKLLTKHIVKGYKNSSISLWYLGGCKSFCKFDGVCALQVDKWLTYDFPPAVKAKVNRLWGGEWHGQAQKWCEFYFICFT